MALSAQGAHTHTHARIHTHTPDLASYCVYIYKYRHSLFQSILAEL